MTDVCKDPCLSYFLISAPYAPTTAVTSVTLGPSVVT